MLYPLPIYEFPDRVAGAGKKLLCGINNSFVEMKKSVLNVVPQKMKVNFVRAGRLTAIVAEMTFKMLSAVFTGIGHILLLKVSYSPA
jgi:hypothetical protein